MFKWLKWCCCFTTDWKQTCFSSCSGIQTVIFSFLWDECKHLKESRSKPVYYMTVNIFYTFFYIFIYLPHFVSNHLPSSFTLMMDLLLWLVILFCVIINIYCNIYYHIYFMFYICVNCFVTCLVILSLLLLKQWSKYYWNWMVSR